MKTTRAIWKYMLPRSVNEIKGSIKQFLKVGKDADGNICVWAIVDPKGECQDYVISLLGTGWEVEDIIEDNVYLGSVNEDAYIWHYFWREAK